MLNTPHIQKWVSNLASKIESNPEIAWIKTNSGISYEWLADYLSSSLNKNLNIYELRDSATDEDIYWFAFDRLRERKINSFKVGDEISGINEKFVELGFDRVNRVWEVGEFSQVGDVITIWPQNYTSPLRLEIFDDEIEKISLLDLDRRRSIKTLQNFSIEDRDEEIDRFFETRKGENPHTDWLQTPIVFSSRKYLEEEINERFNHLSIDIEDTKWSYDLVRDRIEDGWNVLMVVNNNMDSVDEIREGIDGIKVFEDSITKGFESKSLKVMVLSDQEMWGTVKISTFKPGKMSALDINEINPGDFVVHEDHGIALYSGLKEEENLGKVGKYLELKYAQKDRLLVPLSQIKKITKYIGSSSKKPSLTRLSGNEWKRIKKKVSESVRKLAMELLRLYAVRDITNVTPFDIGNGSLSKFEKDFEFVETEDQQQSIEEVYEDLQNDNPMDRLLVGDVGYGKTEVAMRAAFLSVKNGKQVAVLAPTTILVEQHYKVFSDRMEKYGIKVASLSRFLSKDESDKVVENIKKGEVDIVIGTHKLLSKDIDFKNLGLLIVDEEQKFGVSQKEKLKKMKMDLHVLSMSATPIPRTLNMALSGVRDISAITTAPPGRIPVKNKVVKFDWKKITEAIKKEVERGGQVYLVHNRVRTISFVQQKLEELLPSVRFVTGHGQMSGETLSRVMRDFNDGKYDVLICSTIIENGLDMPNVNTLIVDRSEMFGLAQLYQLRGRIGRGTREGYAYFMYGGTAGERKTTAEKMELEEVGETILWEDARRRLQAIENLEDLGSGFELAQKDLEIRGAGNFLGKQQHGNVNSVGFSLYCRLLAEMVEKIKKTTQSE